MKNNPKHIDLLIKKHYDALEKMPILKKDIKLFKNKFLIKINPEGISISNDIVEISDKVTFKIFYQDLCQKYFNYAIYSTKKHWEQFYLFILNSRTNSLFVLDREIKILKYRDYHYLYVEIIKEN